MPADLPVILVPELVQCAALCGISPSNLPRSRRASAKAIMSRSDSRLLLVDAALAVWPGR